MQQHLHNSLRSFCRQQCRRQLYSVQATAAVSGPSHSTHEETTPSNSQESDFEIVHLKEKLSKAFDNDSVKSSTPGKSSQYASKRKDRAEAHVDVLRLEKREPTIEDLDVLKPQRIPKIKSKAYFRFYNELLDQLSRRFSARQLQQFCKELKVDYRFTKSKPRKERYIDGIMTQHWGIESPQEIDRRMKMKASVPTHPSELFLLLGRDGLQLSKLSEKYDVLTAIHPSPLSIQLQGESDSIKNLLTDIKKRRESIISEDVDLPTKTPLSLNLLQQLSRLAFVYIENVSEGKVRMYADNRFLLSKARRLAIRAALESERAKATPISALLEPEVNLDVEKTPSLYSLRPFTSEQVLTHPSNNDISTYRCQSVHHWIDHEHIRTTLPQDRLFLENGDVTSLMKYINDLLPDPSSSRRVTASLGHILFSNEKELQANILSPLPGKWKFTDFIKWLKNEKGKDVQCKFSPSLSTVLLDEEPTQERSIYRLKYRYLPSSSEPSQTPSNHACSETVQFEADLGQIDYHLFRFYLRDTDQLGDLKEAPVERDSEAWADTLDEKLSRPDPDEQLIEEGRPSDPPTLTEEDGPTKHSETAYSSPPTEDVLEESADIKDEHDLYKAQNSYFNIPDISSLMYRKAKETEFLVALPDRPMDMKIFVEDSIEQSPVSDIPEIENYFKVLGNLGAKGLRFGFTSPPLSINVGDKTFILESASIVRQNTETIEVGRSSPIDKVIPGKATHRTFRATLEKSRDLDSRSRIDSCTIVCDDIRDENSWKTFVHDLDTATYLSFKKAGNTVPDIPLEDDFDSALEGFQN